MKTFVIGFLLVALASWPARAEIVIFGGSRLLDAVRAGDAELVDSMLQKRRTPDMVDYDGKSILMSAALSGNAGLF